MTIQSIRAEDNDTLVLSLKTISKRTKNIENVLTARILFVNIILAADEAEHFGEISKWS